MTLFKRVLPKSYAMVRSIEHYWVAKLLPDFYRLAIPCRHTGELAHANSKRLRVPFWAAR
jgi:hypothetical protein